MVAENLKEFEAFGGYWVSLMSEIEVDMKGVENAMDKSELGAREIRRTLPCG